MATNVEEEDGGGHGSGSSGPFLSDVEGPMHSAVIMLRTDAGPAFPVPLALLLILVPCPLRLNPRVLLGTTKRQPEPEPSRRGDK